MEENTNPGLEPTPVESLSSQPMEPTPPSLDAGVEVETIILGSDITDEDRNRVYDRLGRPKSHEEYDLSGIAPENYNQQILDDFKKKAHENGMSNEAARKMAEWYKEIEVKHQEAMHKSKQMQADQWMLELKKDFGTRFDDEVKNARKALDAYTDKSFRQYMDDTGLGNHPALVKAFAKIGRELSEDRLVQSETANRLAKNDELVRAEIARLRADRAFMERYRRGDPAAVKRLNELYQ